MKHFISTFSVPFGDSPPPPSASKLQKDSNSESDEEEKKQPLKQSLVSKLHHQPLGATGASGHYNPNRSVCMND